MSVFIKRNTQQFEIFETFNVILKDNDIATIQSDTHDFKILISFINDESGKSAIDYKFSKENECPFLYFKNWNTQKVASKEILPIAEVTRTEVELETDIETSQRGKLGLQVFAQRTAEMIHATLQFVFEANEKIDLKD